MIALQNLYNMVIIIKSCLEDPILTHRTTQECVPAQDHSGMSHASKTELNLMQSVLIYGNCFQMYIPDWLAYTVR